MVARAYGLDDRVSTSGDVMIGTLTLRGTPPFTIEQDVIGGLVTLSGTSPVSVATAEIDDSTLVLVAVQPGSAPAGIPWVSSITPGTGFEVQSTSDDDTDVVCGWYLVETA
jgi:hypothetical protein